MSQDFIIPHVMNLGMDTAHAMLFTRTTHSVPLTVWVFAVLSKIVCIVCVRVTVLKVFFLIRVSSFIRSSTVLLNLNDGGAGPCHQVALG